MGTLTLSTRQIERRGRITFVIVVVMVIAMLAQAIAPSRLLEITMSGLSI